MIGATSEGCIIPDKGIQFPTDGNKWCATLTNARAWTLGEFIDGQNIADNGLWPSGCVCMQEEQNAQLEGWQQTPPTMGDPDYSAYVELTQDVQDAALAECNDM